MRLYITLLFVCLLLAVAGSSASATTIAQSRSATTPTVSQDGYYCLWGYGNYHGWCVTPHPAASDGYTYAEWSISFDTAAARAGAVTYAAIKASWTINAPTIFPVNTTLIPIGVTTTRQPIKYMTADAAGWLTRLVFSDGYIYWFPGPPRQNPNTIDLVGLGLTQHLQNSTQVTLVGTLQYKLGRAYLDDANGDDWQHANGWAERCSNHAYGSANATGSASLTVDFTPPGVPIGAPGLSPGPITYLTNLKSYYQFCSAEGGGGGGVNCNRAIPASTWELFTLTDLNGGLLTHGDAVTLQASNGKYCSLVYPARGQVTSFSCTQNSAQKLALINVTRANQPVRNGDSVALLGINGLYVTVATTGNHPLYPATSGRSVSAWSQFMVQNFRSKSPGAQVHAMVAARSEDDGNPTSVKEVSSSFTSGREIAAYLTKVLGHEVRDVAEFRFADLQGNGERELITIAETQDVGRILIVVGDTLDGPIPAVFAIPPGSPASLADIVRDVNDDGIPELIVGEPLDGSIPAPTSASTVVAIARSEHLPPPFWVNILKWGADGVTNVSDQFVQFYSANYLPSIEAAIASLRGNAPGNDQEQQLTTSYEVLLFKGRRLLGDQNAGLAEISAWVYSSDITLKAGALEVLAELPLDYATARMYLELLARSADAVIADRAQALLSKQ